MKHEGFDLEGELRAGRSRPRAEFADALAGDVRGRVRRSRIGLSLALAGLMIVAVASFGGIGYAASSKPAAVLKPNSSSAAAQYGTPTPKQTQAKQAKQAKQAPATKAAPQAKEAAKAAEAKATTPKAAAPAGTSANLPFTGLALWVPLAVGLMLIGFGVVLRTRAKRHGSSAH